MNFAKFLRTTFLHLLLLEFREIIHSWQITEITYLSERIFFSYFLFIFFLFQHKLHQSTNTYNYQGNGSPVGRSGRTNPNESCGYYDTRG